MSTQNLAIAPVNRRLQIADIAVELLASKGAHGLTHGAVDRALGLPKGSTSYYFRSRMELFVAAAELLADRILADLDWIENVDITSPDQALEAFVKTIANWIAPPQRTRTVALMELLLAARREPAIDRIMIKIWQGVVDRNRAVYRALDVGDDLAVMEPFRVLMLGLMVRGMMNETEITDFDIKGTLRRLIKPNS